MCKKKLAAKTRGLEIVVQISGYFMVFIMFYNVLSPFPSQELHSAMSWCVHPACDKQSGTQHDTSQKKNPLPFSSTLRFKSCKTARNQDGWPVASPLTKILPWNHLKPLAMVLTRVSRRVVEKSRILPQLLHAWCACFSSGGALFCPALHGT